MRKNPVLEIVTRRSSTGLCAQTKKHNNLHANLQVNFGSRRFLLKHSQLCCNRSRNFAYNSGSNPAHGENKTKERTDRSAEAAYADFGAP
jgi:hypothetical protein